jgi:hypothetical protein
MGLKSIIQLEFKVAPADMEHAIRVYRVTTPLFILTTIVVVTVLVVNIAYFMGLAVTHLWNSPLNPWNFLYSYFDWQTFLYASLGLLLGLLIWFDVFGQFWRRRTYRQHISDYRIPWLVTFEPQSITILRDGSKEVYSWSAFRAVMEGNKEFMLLAKGRWEYLLVPKKAFKTPASENAFRGLLAHNLGTVRQIRWAPPPMFNIRS